MDDPNQAFGNPFNVAYHVHNGADSPQIPFLNLANVPSSYQGQGGKFVVVNSSESGLIFTASGGGGGSGTVTSVSVVTANGISGTVATSTTTPAITIVLGAITPSSIVASGTITGSNLSGTNTGDQNLFSNIPVSGQTTVTANSITTALTLVAGTNMTITTNNTTKTIMFASTGGGGGTTSAGLFGDGSDGSATISTNTTLSRDMYYSALTITSNAVINSNSYRVYVSGALTINSGANSIGNNGGVGGAGVNGTQGNTGTGGGAGSGGSAGTTPSSGTLPAAIAPVQSGGGGTGAPANANGHDSSQGPDGVAVSPSWGSSSSSPGTFKGGAGGGASGFVGGATFTGGNQALATAARNLYHNANAIYTMLDFQPTITQILGSAASPGGSGGSGGAGSSVRATGGGGGGSGGTGGTGGFVVIFAQTIVNNATGGIASRGGAGGVGGTGGDGFLQPTFTGQAGGGGGGQGGFGGTGGVVLLVTTSYTGTGTVDVSGGSAGTGGTGGTQAGGGANGNSGQAGIAGASGVAVTILIT